MLEKSLGFLIIQNTNVQGEFKRHLIIKHVQITRETGMVVCFVGSGNFLGLLLTKQIKDKVSTEKSIEFNTDRPSFQYIVRYFGLLGVGVGVSC